MSSFRFKVQAVKISIQQALSDALLSLVPIVIAIAATFFIAWFWSQGPVDFVNSWFKLKISNPFFLRVIATVLVGFPTIIFVKQSFRNLWKVLTDERAIQHEIDKVFDRLNRKGA